MAVAWFHFYPDLDHFLPQDRREGIFAYPFNNGQSVKHLIEAAGIPHTEVGEVRTNGRPISLDDLAGDGDQVEVYPAEAGQGMPPGGPRFVLDNHLGRLAAYLRMLGFDVVYRNDFADDELARVSAGEERILLTRDRRLLMRRSVKYGYCLRSLDSIEQIGEIVRRYRLVEQIAPFRRCLRCNALLRPVQKAEILDRLEPLTRIYFEDFHICPDCGQIYWKGSHYEHMLALIDRLRSSHASG